MINKEQNTWDKKKQTTSRCDGFTMPLPWSLRDLFQAYKSRCITANQYYQMASDYQDPDTREDECPEIKGFTVSEINGICYYTPKTQA
jgi:hypothetical protein